MALAVEAGHETMPPGQFHNTLSGQRTRLPLHIQDTCCDDFERLTTDAVIAPTGTRGWLFGALRMSLRPQDYRVQFPETD